MHDATAAHEAAAKDAANHPRSGVKAAMAAAAATALDDARHAEAAARATAESEPVVLEESWYPILVGLYGDTPFAAKLRRSVGTAARTGCPNCLLLASKRVPNEDGTPSEQTLKATAYGGFSCMAQVQEPQITRRSLNSFTTCDDFSYMTPNNTFDRQAAESAFITDDLDELMAEAAERITDDHRARYRRSLRAKLESLGPDATAAAKHKGGYPLCRMPPVDSKRCNMRWPRPAVRSAEYNAFYNKCNKEHLAIGRTGRCIFSDLPYYRCAVVIVYLWW